MSFSDPLMRALAEMPRCWLEERKKELLEDILSGKTIVSHSFEGGSVTFQLRGDPSDLLGKIQDVLDWLDVGDDGGDFIERPTGVFLNFSRKWLQS